ncbi:hypothetical protein [Shinella zoogloeoides]|uniref:hypothetical protein n=1 Tax=Shinella zoogloeoides TaxID=352475 RepID=UPI000E652390|nr:hypothetical protein [Shinella zoogloeoides]
MAKKSDNPKTNEAALSTVEAINMLRADYAAADKAHRKRVRANICEAYELGLQLKKSPRMPAGASTEVSVTAMAPPVLGQEYAPIPFKAATAQELFAQLVFQPEEPIVMLFMVFGRGQAGVFPHQATFRFKGNEPDWIVPATSPSAYPALSRAFLECRTELNKFGHRIFSSVESSATSPFAMDQNTSTNLNAAMPLGTEHGAADEKSDDTELSAGSTTSGRWAFTHHEEDWGNVCVVEVKRDNLQIGFMATPGLEKIAYIEGLDVQSANAVWQVDANKAYPLRGERSDYFGFLAFDVPSPNFIEEVMQGTTLNISVIGKAKYAIDVSSARKAFTQFVDCHSKGGATAKAGAAASAAACLDVRDQAQLVFSGRLTQSVFPGPPNYESIDAGDKAETAFLLGLTQPICASGDEFLSSNEEISTIHVYSDDPQTAVELERLADQEVRIVGSEAFGSHTGHHRARLVVHVRSAEPIQLNR